MDQTPGGCRHRLRMVLAHDGLQRGQSLKQISSAAGYTRASLWWALAWKQLSCV